jgi:hypothetical protein
MKAAMRESIRKLRMADPSGKYGVVGFDGFVDEVVHVVDKRYDADSYSRIETIRAYGERIIKAAGLSTNIEIVPIDKKIGGNGTIFASALLAQGFKLTYIGALGYPETVPAFQDFITRCDAYSISEPGYTNAIEFFDGKIIRSKLEGLKDVRWGNLKRVVGVERLRELFRKADYYAFLNWSLVVNVTSIWQGILTEVLPLVESDTRRELFVDLADPEKRGGQDIKTAINALEKIGAYCDVILGLNQKEACEIASLYGKRIPDYAETDINEVLSFLHDRLDIRTILIHSVKMAYAKRKGEESYSVYGPYCEKPKLTTGAGDHFNAGYMAGRICGLSIEESLYTAVYESGYYIRKARSPSKSELIEFMEYYLKKQI